MPQATYHFPLGFLWGTATSSYQVEGNNTNNNWYAWEQAGHIKTGDKAGLADDWWGGRWKEDFDRAAECGQNAHRLSIEWSRIQPTPDRWDEHALDYYREIIRGLLDRGMTPLVTLHHFTNPQWLEERCGWECADAPKLFAAYVSRVVEALKEYVSLWVTINEPNVIVYSGYLSSDFPTTHKGLGPAFMVYENLVRGHAAAYAAIHAIQRTARVGIALNYRGFIPARSWLPMDHWVAGLQHRLFNEFFPRALQTGVLNYVYKRVSVPEAAHTQDFLGVNYYTRDHVAFTPTSPRSLYGRNFFPAGSDLSDSAYISNEPEGMFEALQFGRKFGVPMMVTENGVDCADDHIRPRYLVQHLHQVWRAVNFNWPVKGYFHWTLVDNFEWERGWSQRFGLWALDTQTQIRRKRPSADLYGEICNENGISSEMVARYAPEVLPKLFP
jgi:beta-glucosidase